MINILKSLILLFILGIVIMLIVFWVTNKVLDKVEKSDDKQDKTPQPINYLSKIYELLPQICKLDVDNFLKSTILKDIAHIAGKIDRLNELTLNRYSYEFDHIIAKHLYNLVKALILNGGRDPSKFQEGLLILNSHITKLEKAYVEDSLDKELEFLRRRYED